jgi:hypothetical protein
MTTAVSIGRGVAVERESGWIYNRKWDLAFISLSVILVPMPYLIWLFMSDVFMVESDAGRQAVNLLIAALIGGPHMYATFTRTALDYNFRDISRLRSAHPSSALIPSWSLSPWP